MINVEDQTKQVNQFCFTLLLAISVIALLSSLSSVILINANMTFFARERYVYMGCILILLPLCFVCMRISTYVFDRRHKNDLLAISIIPCLLSFWLIFWLAAIPAIAGFWLLVLYGQPILYASFKHPLFTLCLFVCMSFIGCLIVLRNAIHKIHIEPGRGQYFFWCIALVLLTLLVGSQNVSGLAAIQLEAPRWDSNFEPVLYPISQVVAGKTLLVDLPAQYGLYAELLAPIYKLFGFSIAGITFLFALMEAVSYLSLLVVFLKLTKLLIFRLFWALSAAVLFGFAFQNYPSYMYFDPYYQYYPIRLFFPAVSVFLFWNFISVQPRIRSVILFTIFLTCGVIWNLDSGIPALGSFFVYLMLSAFFTRAAERRWWIKAFMLTVLGMTITLALFATYMTLKAGVSVPWSEWLRYQRIFYMLGYGAIPLPLSPHPWMAVVAIYVMGILGYMHFAHKQSADNFWKLMLYLSVMGLGLFAYYQHRSHDAVFLAAFWPALFMGYVCSERFLGYIMKTRLPTSWLLMIVPSFILGAVFSGFFIYKVPTMLGQAKYNWAMAFSNKKTPIIENIVFMRAKLPAQDRDSVELITWLQAIYFSELGIPSVVKGPGTGGAMPGEDQAALIVRLRAAKPRIIFLQKGFMPLVEEAVKNDYKVIDENKNQMKVLQIRSEDQM